MLTKAHEAATAFRQAFEGRPRRGNTTDAEQDLLRAMLVFAGAGLDAMVKEMIRQALPIAIERSKASPAFESFIKRRCEGVGPVDHKFLASVLANPNPRQFLIAAWIADLTGGSLQSVEALAIAASAFDVKFSDIVPNRAEEDLLKRAFKARNQIVHEMDLDFTANRARRQRRIAESLELTQQVFTTAERVLLAVEAKLA
jgi:hypothetical protein